MANRSWNDVEIAQDELDDTMANMSHAIERRDSRGVGSLLKVLDADYHKFVGAILAYAITVEGDEAYRALQADAGGACPRTEQGAGGSE